MVRRIDFIEVAAKQKLEACGVSLPLSWRLFRWRVVGNCLICDGSETTIPAKGKSRGRTKWIGEKVRVIVTDDDTRRAEDEYERNSGNCHLCCGDGQEWVGWSIKDGDKYKSCSRCGGSGKSKRGGS